eukprot:766151-Pelagomonas_calceolata.AAC.3
MIHSHIFHFTVHLPSKLCPKTAALPKSLAGVHMAHDPVHTRHSDLAAHRCAHGTVISLHTGVHISRCLDLAVQDEELRN